MIEFGEKLKHLREEKGMTQQTMADILAVSIDELLSGEELKEHVNKAAVLEKKAENIIQTVIYAIAMFAITVFVTIKYMLNTVLLFAGIILSAKGKRTAKTTGYIMSMPYVISAIEFLFTFTNMMIRNNGYMSLSGWITDIRRMFWRGRSV